MKKYTYNYMEWSQDTRHIDIESDKQLSYDDIIDCASSVEIKDGAIYNDKKNGIKVAFKYTEWGDDTQVDISGDELKE